jgi:hypothetical protein
MQQEKESTHVKVGNERAVEIEHINEFQNHCFFAAFLVEARSEQSAKIIRL